MVERRSRGAGMRNCGADRGEGEGGALISRLEGVR